MRVATPVRGQSGLRLGAEGGASLRPLFMVAGAVAVVVLIDVATSQMVSRKLLDEDGPVEWVSATAFALAALGAVTRPRRRVGDGWLHLYVGAMATLCCLSELSFGARIFGWDMPDMRGGGELDGAHDVVLLVWREVSGSPFRLAVAGAALLLGLAGGLWIARHAGIAWQGMLRWLARDRVRLMVAVASLGLAFALSCDLLEQPRLKFVEEPVELFGATLLAVSMWTRRESRRAGAVAGRGRAGPNDARPPGAGRQVRG